MYTYLINQPIGLSFLLEKVSALKCRSTQASLKMQKKYDGVTKIQLVLVTPHRHETDRIYGILAGNIHLSLSFKPLEMWFSLLNPALLLLFSVAATSHISDKLSG